MLRCGAGGLGGGNTGPCIQGARSVEHEIRRAFRCEIIRMSLADSGHVKVWKGRTVGAAGMVKVLGT